MKTEKMCSYCLQQGNIFLECSFPNYLNSPALPAKTRLWLPDLENELIKTEYKA